MSEFCMCEITVWEFPTSLAFPSPPQPPRACEDTRIATTRRARLRRAPGDVTAEDLARRQRLSEGDCARMKPANSDIVRWRGGENHKCCCAPCPQAHEAAGGSAFAERRRAIVAAFADGYARAPDVATESLILDEAGAWRPASFRTRSARLRRRRASLPRGRSSPDGGDQADCVDDGPANGSGGSESSWKKKLRARLARAWERACVRHALLIGRTWAHRGRPPFSASYRCPR